MHSLEQEKIVKISQKDKAALVQTKHIDEDDFVSNYEYHLKVINGSWRISSVLYVDEDGKTECL